MKLTILKTLLFTLLFLLSGCGGSSNGTTTQINTTTPADTLTPTITGTFIDSAVSGLAYTCAKGLSGETNSDGEYTCNEDDNVTFYIGGIAFGPVTVSLTPITPSTIFPHNSEAALNLAQLLQSLDVNNDLSDGISLDEDKVRLLEESNIVLDFESNTFDTDLASVIGKIVSNEDAFTHLNETLVSLGEESITDTTAPGLDENAPVFTSSTTASVNENQTSAISIVATDDDTVTYSLSGTDSISSLGVVTFNTAPNFEDKTSYSFTVSATDTSSNESTQNIIITILDLDEDAPVFTSATTASVYENQTSAITLVATDDSTISYSITEGEASDLQVDATSGVVSFISAPNFEGTYSYGFTATATDEAGNTVTQSVKITILDLDENTSLTGSFSDFTISGLNYTTQSHSGITNALGEFTYEEGESVSFYIGDYLLGTTLAAEKISTFSLVEGSEILTGSAISRALDDTFNHVINLTVLLQTLDTDLDSTNGLQISDQLSTIFDNTDLDLTKGSDSFVDSFAFKKVMNHANSTSAFSEPRQVCKAWFAMKNLYDALGISGPYARVSYLYDSDNNSSTDNTLESNLFNVKGELSSIIQKVGGAETYIYTNTYDDYGNLTQSELDDDANTSSTNRLTTYVYDAYGNKLEYHYDSDNNGMYNRNYIYTYDVYGNKLSYDEDKTEDNIADKIYTYAYDSNNNRIKYAVDSDGDGDTDTLTLYTYNDDNKLLNQLYYGNEDGLLDSNSTYTYDANGNKIQLENDDSGDGTLDRVHYFTYDTSNNNLSYQYDNYANGSIDIERFYTYNEDNLQINVLKYSDDIGTLDSNETYSYDENGNRLISYTDSDGDGTIDSTITYRYDENSNKIYDKQETNSATKIRNYTYDDNNNRIFYSEDTDGDGTVDRIKYYTYDAYNNMIEYAYDSDANGEINTFIYYVYDENINLIEKNSDNDADGIFESIKTYTYSLEGGWFYLLGSQRD